MKIIGFTGKACAGKNTAASFIYKQQKNKECVTELAFGTAVKNACAEIFNVHVKNFYFNKNTYNTKWGLTYREMMQKVGTDLCRIIDEDIWVKRLSDEYNKISKLTDLVLITDVRFPNEAKWIRNKGGIIVEIIRGKKFDYHNHKSEKGLPTELINKTIINNGDLKKLKFLVNFSLDNFLYQD